tara:strand:- start:73 stop:210 length:138 start_codon:yes stop_codon:yes gene_type:complete
MNAKQYLKKTTCVTCGGKVTKVRDIGINLHILDKVVCKKCFQEAD